MTKQDKELYEFQNFCLDVSERKLSRLDGEATIGSLREKAFEVLLHLVRNPGMLLTKEDLISTAWPDTVVEEANLSKTIHAIRVFLGQAPGNHRYIETVPKHGYRFVADVERIGGTSIAAREVGDDSREGLSFAKNLPNAVPDFVPMASSRAPTQGIGTARAFWLGAIVVLGVFAATFVTQTWKTAQGSPQDPSVEKARDDPSRAYDLYIRGKVKAGVENREETEAAIKLLEEAVQLDPASAGAYAQLARAYNTRAFKFSSAGEQKRFHENAEVAVQKALDLNPDFAEAHFARGLILWSNTKGFPHEMTIQSYKRSLELDPKQDETHHQLSIVYAHIGLLDEAQQSLKTALELNPNNTMARFRVGNYLAWQGKPGEALAVLKTIPGDVSPLLVDRIKAEALIQTGQLQEAQAIVDNYLASHPDDEGGSFTSVNALLLAKAGKRAEAESAIIRAAEIGKGFGHFHHTEYNIAAAYAAMKEADLAIKWLKSAADHGFPCYACLKVDPNLDNIRGDKNFIDLLQAMEQDWNRLGS